MEAVLDKWYIHIYIYVNLLLIGTSPSGGFLQNKGDWGILTKLSFLIITPYGSAL